MAAFRLALTSAAIASSSSTKRTFPPFFFLLLRSPRDSVTTGTGEGAAATSVEREPSVPGALGESPLGESPLGESPQPLDLDVSEVDDDVSTAGGASPGTALAVSSAGRIIFQLPLSTTLVFGSCGSVAGESATRAMEDSSKDPATAPAVLSAETAGGGATGTRPAAAILSLDLDSDSRSAVSLAFLCASTEVRSPEILV